MTTRVLPQLIDELNVAVIMHVESLTAAGNFVEAEHPRDGKGKFVKKIGAGVRLGKKIKITYAWVYKKHPVGETVAVTKDGNKRVSWNGKQYEIFTRSSEGEDWSGGEQETFNKGKAYQWFTDSGEDWYELKDVSGESQSDQDTSDSSASVSTQKKIPSNAGTPLKITHALIHKKHGEPGSILAENGDGDKRVVWDGDQYRLQRKTDSGAWTTEKTAIKSKAYDAIKDYDSDWREPAQANITTDSDAQTADTVKSSDPNIVESAKPAATPNPEPELPKTGLGPALKPLDDFTFQATHKKGALYNDDEGQTWFVTTPPSESHARNQFLAASLYAFAGTPVEWTQLVDTSTLPSSASGVGVAAKYEPGTLSLIEAMKTNAKTQQQVHENFAIDAWLGNWDAVGLGYENMTVDKSGNVKRTNVGGSLLYRANGAPKGAAFGNTVTEIDSLRNPSINPASAKIFANITDDDIRKGVAAVEAITPKVIDFIVNESGFTGTEADKLKSTLKARREDLISKYGSNAPKPATSDGPASSSQPTATNALGGAKTYTAAQKAKVQTVFAKHELKWYNKTDKIYDAALEVSKTHSDLTLGDALNIMDQSLKKKTGNPFRTKVEKWLKTKAGKNHALSVGGSASIGSTSSTTPVSSGVTTPASSSGGNYGGYKKLNRASASAMQKNMDAAFPPPWTAEQRQSLVTYTGGSYRKINKCARGTGPCDEHTKTLIQNIKEGMKPSTEDVIVFRKADPKSFGLENSPEVEELVGKVINDQGVVSTSIKSDLWSGKLHLEIEAPKGSMMAWVQPISLHPGEDEIVIAPGTHYEVLWAKKLGQWGSSPTYTVRLRVIPGSDARTAQLKELEKLKELGKQLQNAQATS